MEIIQQRAEIAHLKLWIAKLRRHRFGRRSERAGTRLNQLELQLEELETGAAEIDHRIDPAGSGPRLLAQRVPERKSAKNRLHLDLHLDSRQAVADEVRRLVALGARHHGDHDEHGTAWSVLSDPEGNEFCLGARSG